MPHQQYQEYKKCYHFNPNNMLLYSLSNDAKLDYQKYEISDSFNSGSDGKASVCKAGDPVSILGSGRSPGEGNGSPLQYPCLENPIDGGAW